MSATVLSPTKTAAKTRPQACTTGHVAFGDGVDHVLADTRIDEDILHHDDADDEIGKIERHHRNDRPCRVRQGMARDDARSRQSLEEGHFDIGGRHDRQDRACVSCATYAQ